MNKVECNICHKQVDIENTIELENEHTCTKCWKKVVGKYKGKR